MAIALVNLALRVTGLHPAHAKLLATLANYANEDGIAWPSIPTLARDIDTHRVSIFRGLARLERLGYLHRRTGRGIGHSNRYTVHRAALEANVGKVLPLAASTKRNSSVTQKVTVVLPDPSSTRTRPPVRPPKGGPPPEKRDGRGRPQPPADPPAVTFPDVVHASRAALPALAYACLRNRHRWELEHQTMTVHAVDAEHEAAVLRPWLAVLGASLADLAPGYTLRVQSPYTAAEAAA